MIGGRPKRSVVGSAIARSLVLELLIAAILAGTGHLAFSLGNTTSLPTWSCVAIAVPAGAATFALLAVLRGGWRALSHFVVGFAPATAVVATMLFASAAIEEAVWRGGLFAALLERHGVAFALVVSTAAFALFHVREQRWLALMQLITGAAFACAYYLTGNLATAVVMHGTFNVLVVHQRIGFRRRRRDDDASDSDAAAEVGADPTVVGPFWTSGAAAPASAPLAQLVDVHKRLGGTDVLRGVGISVEAGEVVALLGPNGAGKTTAISVLLGRRRPDTGSALLFGLRASHAAARRQVGIVLQEMSFPPTLNIGEVAKLVAVHYPDPADPDEVLAFFDLLPLKTGLASSLSGGQKRRLAAALAMIPRPLLLVMDEPTAGLDFDSRTRLIGAVQRHSAAGGAALVSTHYLPEAMEIATRVVVLDLGVVVADEPVGSFKRDAPTKRGVFRCASPPVIRSALKSGRAGDAISVYTHDADEVVRELVTSGVRFSHLSIESVPAFTGEEQMEATG